MLGFKFIIFRLGDGGTAMAEIWTMGELLVEIMRPRPGMKLYECGEFVGPLPSFWEKGDWAR